MSANALQTAVVERLASDPGLLAIIGADRIFDRQITRAEPPYLVLGEMTTTDFPPAIQMAASIASRSRPGPNRMAASRRWSLPMRCAQPCMTPIWRWRARPSSISATNAR